MKSILLIIIILNNITNLSAQQTKIKRMKVAVWDTYVKRKDGKTMHFDILAPNNVDDTKIIFGYGNQYLENKPFETIQLTCKECRLCHIEEATQEIVSSIKTKGYFIIEIQNCN